MTEETEEVFRGHLEECLSHLGETLAKKYPKGSKGISRSRQPMAEFCGVEIHSIGRWLDGKGFPQGEQWIRLICFLNLHGYRIIEFEYLPKSRKYFFELIGFEILTMQEANEIAGFADSSNLFQILHGNVGTSKEKDNRMFEAWASRKEELAQKKTQARELYRLETTTSTEEVVSSRHKPARAVESSSQRRAAVVSIMEGLSALLEEEAFEALLFSELARNPEAVDPLLRILQRLNSLSFKLVAQIKGGDR